MERARSLRADKELSNKKETPSRGPRSLGQAHAARPASDIMAVESGGGV